MYIVHSPIHQNIKQKIVASSEQVRRLVTYSRGFVTYLQVKDTVHIFRTLRNTARVYKNKVSQEVVRLEHRPQGAKFEELRDLVSGSRGRVSLLSSVRERLFARVLTFGYAGRVRDW